MKKHMKWFVIPLAFAAASSLWSCKNDEETPPPAENSAAPTGPATAPPADPGAAQPATGAPTGGAPEQQQAPPPADS